MNAIETKDLTKKYKDLTAVDSINFSVKEGELISLLGINGAGKTTTIKMLSCLSNPTSGKAFVFGHNVQEEPLKVKEIINVSPQQTAVAENLTVYENLELICGIYNFSKQKTKNKCEEIITQFNLEEIRYKKAKSLSGGWQRRLSIALAILTDPKVLFLDEPTLGLDVIARKNLWKIIKELKNRMSIILTTHYLEEARDLSDRIIILSKGKIVAQGTVEELIKISGTNNFDDAFIELCERETK